MKKVLIIGDNPLKASLEQQYTLRGAEIVECDYNSSLDIDNFDEFVIVEDFSSENSIKRDNTTIDKLSHIAKSYSRKGSTRPIVHLLLQSQTSLWMLQTMDLPSEINEKFDVYPFTIEDVWAKNVLVQLPGIKNISYPPLDRSCITSDSNSFVHLIISGFDSQAEAIAIHVALTAHYPNYKSEDSLPLRTRITIIDECVKTKRDVFVSKYQHLFDNSYYRTIDLDTQHVEFHRPIYEGKRADFVDVEWEFVDGTIHHPEVCKKIESWSNNKCQQLTFFICHDDDEKNLSESLALPRGIYEKEIPVIVQQRNNGLTDTLLRSATYKNVRPFGMKDSGYDVTLPLVQLAKYLKYFYDCSYGNIGVPTELPLEQVEHAWNEEKSFKMRFSNIWDVL